MVQRLLSHVRNNGIAYAALFVALSGTAIAASSAVPRNSVGTAQLKNRAVTGPKVALGTLTGANVAKATLTGANIRSSTLGTVRNAAHLGGLTPVTFQRAITGRCLSRTAIQAVSRLGKVTCESVGTIRRVTAATGLTGGGTSGNVSLAVDPTIVQARVRDSCGAGRAMSTIGQDGTITCHTTNVTQMMGATGTATLSPTSDFIVPVGSNPPSSVIGPAEIGSADAPSTARHLFVRVAAAPASGARWTFLFFVNGARKSTLTCVISGPSHSCRGRGSVSIPRGARVALHETGTNITAGTTATFGWTDTTF
ncbi:MAG: hypothetical protein ACJ764_01100 [Solirubrobacteraceae bacterium]